MIQLCFEYLSVQCIRLYVLIMSHRCLRVSPHSIAAWMSRNSLLEEGAKSSLAKHLSVRLQTKWLYVRGFECSCSHLKFRFRACFEQGVPWHTGNYLEWIHSETRTWHDKNIQSIVGLSTVWFIFKCLVVC